jgi:hypothetical protein
MLFSFDETAKMISSGKLLHIAGTESLLKKLPKGNWIGGSTEYFMVKEGGKITGEEIFVTEMSCTDFSIKTYSLSNIEHVATDAFSNGFSIIIIPFNTELHKEYARSASGYKEIFMRNIVGWISGLNVNKSDQTPITVDGTSLSVFTDKAVVLHLRIPDDKIATVNIVNIFEQDKSTPLITFKEEGFIINKCFIDGKETSFADYLLDNKIETQKFPLVGDYSGNGINAGINCIKDGQVHLYAPVFSDIEYRMAKSLDDYEKEFNNKIDGIKETNARFSCNCLTNFMQGKLEGKKIHAFEGPVTFGEIAYELVNQTLVYVTVI